MTTENQQKTGASGAEAQTVTAATTDPNPAQEKKLILDGKEVVYMSDFIAAKKSWEKQQNEQQKAHNDAIDKAKLEVSATQTKVAELNAQVTTLTQKMGAASTTSNPEEVAKLKKERDEALGQIKTLTEQNTTARVASMAEMYKIPAEPLKGKSSGELDAIETALKALKPILGGAGNYAITGGVGSAVPEVPMDRAKKLLASTPIRGTRNP